LLLGAASGGYQSGDRGGYQAAEGGAGGRGYQSGKLIEVDPRIDGGDKAIA